MAKQGPNGKFLPRDYRGSYFEGGKAYDKNGKQISKEKALENFKRSARKNPDLNRFLKSKIKLPKAKRRDYGGYKSGKYSVDTMDPKKRYIILADALLRALDYADRKLRKLIRTYTIGAFTKSALERSDFESLVRERILARLKPREELLQIIGIWRRPKPLLSGGRK
jgi:hypothetical protein